MYGDSLLESASPYVRSTDQVRAFGGTALCDWADNMARAAAIEQRVNVPILWVGPPVFRNGPPPTKGLLDSERRFVDAGAAVLDDGKFAASCRACHEEPGRGCGADDEISVRATDGVHFGTIGSSYVSGARRFANAIDEAIKDQR